jgi:hypothetical protein
VRNPGDQRREDQRRDDHLDQPQEQGGDDAEIFGDGLEARVGRCRSIVDRLVDRPAGDDPEHQSDQDVAGQILGHRREPKPLASSPSSFTAGVAVG